MKKNRFTPKGFSIVELLVVVAIIGILSAVAVPAYFNHVNRTRQANAVQKLMDIKTAQEKYYALYDRYAPDPITATTFSSLLSFDPSHALYYAYSIKSSSPKNFTAQARGNNSYLNHDCWEISDNWADPSTCGPGPAGFSLSVIADLFN